MRLGAPKTTLSPSSTKKVAPRIYKIKIPRLGVGEYAFLAPGAVASANASIDSMMVAARWSDKPSFGKEVRVDEAEQLQSIFYHSTI